MKKSILLFVFALFTLAGFSQAPKGLNYQGVARNSGGTVFNNGTPVSVTFSIRDGSAFGNIVFTETQNANTNQYGLFNLTIGSVNSSSFGQISWSSGPKFLEVNIIANGTQLPGVTTQLMSVPYALFSENTNLQAGNGITLSGNTISNTGDLSNTNEIQALSVNGNQLTLSNGGGTVNLPFPETLLVEQVEATGGGTYPVAQTFQKIHLNSNQGSNTANMSFDPTTSFITLKAGKYFVTASAPAKGINRHFIALRKSNGSDLLFGTSEITDGTSIQTTSTLSGFVNVPANQQFEVQLMHWCQLNNNDINALGESHAPYISGVGNTYARITIQKVN